MKKQIGAIVLSILLIIIGVLSFQLIMLTNAFHDLERKQHEAMLEIDQLQVDVDRKSVVSGESNDGLSRMEALLNQMDDKVRMLESELDGYQIKQMLNRLTSIESKIANIPVDETLNAKAKVKDWLSLFSGKQASQVNGALVKEAMGVNSDFYYDHYAAFESPESIEKLTFMIQTVFQEGEGYTVELISETNQVYRVNDTDGNAFDVYLNDDGIYSLWVFGFLCDQYFSEFAVTIIQHNQQDTFTMLAYEAYDATPEDVETLLSKHLKGIDGFDLSSLSYLFKGIDVDGFQFTIYDRAGHTLDFHVNHSDGFTSIKNADLMWGE
ncbi:MULTISPECIES: hypothetical protein [unclassified Fusibacter]|uniref:hypothetical protein n=1 Tax=unclassified Fusibacter TaxID=2624464 RepID=UPI001013BD96|nr:MULTISPECIES: hypothetical protein [unclassified Fusibacter]MCK8060730.1 hypothetical protein [Fusibacter sp. A2]NPE23025.1 hypothetical protein [Fusibacter sp. A1]RXV59699.1 hypothetical protein DWB64_14375 [Fusibacter sp. A1]